MTKVEYMECIRKLYTVANLSDSDSPERVDWLDASACRHQCQQLDKMLTNLVKHGCLTEEEHRTFIDTL